MSKTKTAAVEARAYSQKQLDAFGAKGQAFKNADGVYSYPTPTVADWKRAKRAVGRGGADHDAIRKYLISRAKDLGISDLVPDSWNADGSLEGKAMWDSTETRETYSDLYLALSDALKDVISDMDGCYCGWLCDFDEDRIYFQAGGALYAADYEVEDGGPISIGEPERVRSITTYVPAEASERMEDDVWIEAKAPSATSTGSPSRRRMAPRTQEWREQRAADISASERKRPEPRPQRTVPIELREDSDEEGIVVESYASLFNSPYTVGSGSYRYEECVRPGAFKRSLLNGPDVVFRTEHTNPPLARTTVREGVGSLRLIEDERGLFYRAVLDPEDRDVQSLVPKLRSGVYSESSFAFRAIEDEFNSDFTKRELRVCELDRGDVSVVTFGASPATGQFMQLRSAAYEALCGHADELIEALVEWRDWTLTPLEVRAGKTLSSATTSTLKHVLSLAVTSDEAVDELQQVLADLLDVPNPDKDGGAAADDDETEDDETEAKAATPLVRPASLRDLRRELRRVG